MSARTSSTTAAMPRPAMPSPRRSGGTQTPWTCAAYGEAHATSALNTSRPRVEPGEGPAAADELADPGAVELRAAAVLGRDADLLGVHRDARRVDLRHVVGGGAAYVAGRARRSAAPSISMCGWSQRSSRGRPMSRRRRSRTSAPRPAGPTTVETVRPRVSARSAKTAGVVGGRLHRHQVGAHVAGRASARRRRTGPTSRRRASAARGWWSRAR